MFPTAHSQIYRNEEGEVLGWDNTYHDEPVECLDCNQIPCMCIEDDDDEYDEYSDEDDELEPWFG